MTERPEPPYTARLSEKEILEAVKLWLYVSGKLSSDVGLFRHRFGMVGDPMITLVGDAVDLPDCGDMYLDWAFEPLPNVSRLPTRKKE